MLRILRSPQTREKRTGLLALLLLLPALALAASYTPDVEIRVPEGTSVKVTKRATNTSKDVLVTVNKDSRYTITTYKPANTPPVVVPPVVTPPAGTSDFDARKSAPGVVRYFDFDTPASVNIGCTKSMAECQNFKVDAGNLTTPTIDTAVKASGAGSLRFDVASGKGSSNAAGAFNANFSADLKTQFGENSEFFVQWRQRFNAAMVDTQITTNDGSPQGGIKMMGIEAGDVADPAAPYGFRQHAACEAIGVLVQTYYQTRIPISYNSCTGSASHGPYAGLYTNEPGGDYGLQNAAGCLYSKTTTPPCFRWVADEWLTFEVRVKTGARVNGEFANSEYQLWAAGDGKAPRLLIDWHPGVGGYFPLTANDGNTGEQQTFGKVWLLPYTTARNETITLPLMQTWYDELIISRQPITFPGGFALAVPRANVPPVTPPVVVPPVVTPPAPMTGLPAWRAGKAVGTWFEIQNTAGMAGIVHPAEWNPIDGWNGLGAGGTQWICAACGGHGDWQNQVHVIEFNADAPRWTTVDPGSPKSAVTVGAYYADGKPTSRHTYQSTQVVGDRVFLFGVYATYATGFTDPGAFMGGGNVDAFNLTARKWDPAGTWAQPPFYVWIAAVCRDPRDDSVYYAGDYTIARWNAGKWTAPLQGKPGLRETGMDAWQSMGCAVDTKRGRVLSIVDGQPYYEPGVVRLQYVDTKTNALGRINVTGDLKAITTGNATVYDPDGDRYLYFMAGKVYAINPETGASVMLWTLTPPLASTENRAAYFPQLGGVAYLPRYDSNVFFLPTR
jgi:hypothetical protein